jgi:hypothetical protein
LDNKGAVALIEMVWSIVSPYRVKALQALSIVVLVAIWGCAPSAAKNSILIRGASPSVLATMGDGVSFSSDLWTSDGGSIVGYIDPQLRLREYRVPDNGVARGIVAHHGRVWFTSAKSAISSKRSDAVVELDLATGMMHSFKIPTPEAHPGRIAVAENGALFFTEDNANAIGEIRDGRVVEHRLPGGLIRDHAGPVRLTVAKNGSVIFVESRTGRIGILTKPQTWRFLPSLVVDEVLTEIAADGNTIWITNPISKTIDSISLVGGSGNVKSYRLPWQDDGPSALAVAGGKVCFAGRTTVGCRDGTGFHRLSFPPSRVSALAVGRTGVRLWYATDHVPGIYPWTGEVGLIGQ